MIVKYIGLAKKSIRVFPFTENPEWTFWPAQHYDTQNSLIYIPKEKFWKSTPHGMENVQDIIVNEKETTTLHVVSFFPDHLN